jgi:hypothetical protein
MEKINIKNYTWYEFLFIFVENSLNFFNFKNKYQNWQLWKKIITTQLYKIGYYLQFLTPLQTGTHPNEPKATIGKLQSYTYPNEGAIFKLMKNDNFIQINRTISFDIDTNV